MCDKPTRLRKAILGLTAVEKSAPELAPEDVKNRWARLAGSGGSPVSIAQEANSENISDERFKFLMSKLNSYL